MRKDVYKRQKIEWAKNVKVGYLDQHAVLERGMTIRDVLKSAFNGLFEMEERMNALCADMGDAPEEHLEAMMEELGTIQDLLLAHDFYVIDAKVEEIGRALGLYEIGLDKDVTDLSGGQRTDVYKRQEIKTWRPTSQSSKDTGLYYAERRSPRSLERFPKKITSTASGMIFKMQKKKLRRILCMSFSICAEYPLDVYKRQASLSQCASLIKHHRSHLREGFHIIAALYQYTLLGGSADTAEKA